MSSDIEWFHVYLNETGCYVFWIFKIIIKSGCGEYTFCVLLERNIVAISFDFSEYLKIHLRVVNIDFMLIVH